MYTFIINAPVFSSRVYKPMRRNGNLSAGYKHDIQTSSIVTVTLRLVKEDLNHIMNHHYKPSRKCGNSETVAVRKYVLDD